MNYEHTEPSRIDQQPTRNVDVRKFEDHHPIPRPGLTAPTLTFCASACTATMGFLRLLESQAVCTF